jgi:hypothetical protein
MRPPFDFFSTRKRYISDYPGGAGIAVVVVVFHLIVLFVLGAS